MVRCDNPTLMLPRLGEDERVSGLLVDGRDFKSQGFIDPTAFIPHGKNEIKGT